MYRRWMFLFSFSYTNAMNFAPLQSSIPDDPVTIDEAQWQQLCSPRSVYSLATSVGIPDTTVFLGSDESKSLE